jgi:type VI secretion system protein ImpE
VTTGREFFESGKLNEAIEALGVELREHPSDVQRRTFLFELLCFAGNWDRADNQLDILAGDDKDKRMGALLYRAAINGERTRQEMFRDKLASANGAAVAAAAGGPVNGRAATVSGSINGKEFQSLEDADPRIGARLEVLAGINYMWVPLEHITLIEMDAPKRLRDLLWAPARVHTSEGFEGADLGEVLLPVLSPASGSHADDAVRLGRATVWEQTPDGSEIPFGQKMLIADGEEFPLLELRRLEIRQPAG